MSVVRSLRELLSHFLKLLTDYRSVKTIDGDVTPVSFFAFHDEVRKTCGVGCVMAGLRNQVDQQAPCARLYHFRERPRDDASRFFAAGERRGSDRVC